NDLQSPHVLASAIQRGELERLQTFEGVKDPVGYIRSNLKVTRVRDVGEATNIVRLSYRGKDPDDCKRILSAIVDAYQFTLDELNDDEAELRELFVRPKKLPAIMKNAQLEIRAYRANPNLERIFVKTLVPPRVTSRN